MVELFLFCIFTLSNNNIYIMKLKTIFKILVPTLAVIGLLFGWATWKITLLSMVTNFSIFGTGVFVFIWIMDNWDKEVI